MRKRTTSQGVPDVSLENLPLWFKCKDETMEITDRILDLMARREKILGRMFGLAEKAV